MAVSNDNTSSSIIVNVRQTSVYTNVTLYLATDICLPSIPRIGETVQLGGALRGKVENVSYHSYYNTDYRDKLVTVYLTEADLPKFNRSHVIVDLERKYKKFSFSSKEIKYHNLDWCHQILASRKERPSDMSSSEAYREGPDYDVEEVQDIQNYVYFDAEAFDKAFPEVF